MSTELRMIVCNFININEPICLSLKLIYQWGIIMNVCDNINEEM
jgi:hypothetical protein